MGLAGPSLGCELRALALSYTAPVPAWHRLRTRSPSRVQTAPSVMKLTAWPGPAARAARAGRSSCSWPCMRCSVTLCSSTRTDAAAQLERVAIHHRGVDSGMETCHGRATHAELVSCAARLAVGSCIRDRGYFPPHPVEARRGAALFVFECGDGASDGA